jgi:hypothetical protein
MLSNGYNMKDKLEKIRKTLKGPLDYYRVAYEIAELFLITTKAYVKEIAISIARKESCEQIEKLAIHLAYLEEVDNIYKDVGE